MSTRGAFCGLPLLLLCLPESDSDKFKTVLNATNFLLSVILNQQAWQPTVAPNSLIPERASQRIASGNFLRIPLLWGTNVST